MLNSVVAQFVIALVVAMVVLPLLAFSLVALLQVSGRTPKDKTLAGLARLTFTCASLAGLVAGGLYVLRGGTPLRVAFGHWFSLGEPDGRHYGFDVAVLIDGVSLVYLSLTAILCGTVGAFSLRYMQNERGAGGFLQLLLLFTASMSLLTVAESLDLLFVGWELVGITSALLIAFYRDRSGPVRHGLLAFAIYRVCDGALLTALIVLHHATGSSSLPTEVSIAGGGSATLFGILILVASLGKSAQWPFSSWLPRAMEGPTPSSAIMYGALSIHAGAYLLLRTAPLWESSSAVRVAVVAIGLVSAALGSLVGRAQTDAKSSLAYAAIVQVGLIYMEIGFGWQRLALMHVAGHAILRTFEFLRAPSLIADHQVLESQLGNAAPRTGALYERMLPKKVRESLYVLALERGYADAVAARFFGSARRILLAFDRFDERTARLFDPADVVCRSETPPSIVAPAKLEESIR